MSVASWKWGVVVAGVLCGCGGNAPARRAVVPANAPDLHLEGRFDSADPAGPRFEWPGTAVWLRFTGTSVQVKLGEHSLESDDYEQVAHNWYDVTVDGQALAPLQASEGVHTYPLAAGLTKGEHLLVLRKRTEGYVGEAQLLGFELDLGASTLPVPAARRRIEFVGDSITAGFGVDGPDAKCSFSAATENYSHTYAALAAQALGAEQSVVSASGAGVYRNWGGTTINTAADLYERALPTRPTSLWGFGWKPDVVVINLGTSDFTLGDPGSAAFVAAYRALVARVRRDNPSALIALVLGPMVSDLWPAGAQALTQSRAYLTALVSELNAAGDARVKLIELTNQDAATSFGCKSHPSVTTHRLAAAQLTVFLRQQLGW